MIAWRCRLAFSGLAGNSRSSWAAETYPWLVMVNWRVLSNEPVLTTQYTAPSCVSEPGLKVWLTSVVMPLHSWPCACESWVMKSPLVLIPPSGQDAGGGLPTLRPAAPHSSPSGIGRFLRS